MRRSNSTILALSLVLAASASAAEAKTKAAKVWPKLDIAVKQSNTVEQKVTQLMAKMSLEHKIAQMIQPEIRSISVADMRKYGFGSYLNGGGSFPDNNKHATPQDWIALAEKMYQASIDDSQDGSTIPTMWGTDAVHGHNNVIGATLFPHNIGLGAANNADLIEQIAAVTAREVMVTGIDWVFAPTVAVVRDDRWGRTYEGYSEDPEIVRAYSAAIVNGLQGKANKDFLSDTRVVSTVKHFLGDGGTEKGDDQGNNLSSEADLFRLHAQGYVGGLTAGAQTVMASFNSWHGAKLHGHKYLLTDVLKERMGFDGFVVGDWNGHGQVKGCDNTKCAQAVNAGLDVFMAPGNDWKALFDNTIKQVKSGDIAMSRIDDAVRRILRVKVRAGLFEKPSPAKRPLAGKTELIGSAAHRAVARQAVQESLVLLKNNDNLLPLSPKQNILLAGDGADNIGKQSGGWTITWQGTGNNNKDFPGGQSIYDGFVAAAKKAGGKVELAVDGKYQTKPDVAIVVFGEDPYAEGNGDLDNLEFERGNKTNLKLLKKLKADGIKVVSVFLSGRPMWVNQHLNVSDAFVAAWLPGSEGAGVADVLLDNNIDFKGKLSFSWPASPDQTTVNRGDANYKPLFPYGYGLNYQDKVNVAKLSESVNNDPSSRSPLPILQGTVKKPWSLFIAHNGKRQAVNSAVAGNETLQIQTIDKVVQEDARKLKFSGKGTGSMIIDQPFPDDLRDYSENQGVLSFDARLDSDASEGVFVAINCQWGCNNGLDIRNALSMSDKGQWQNIKIPLGCFKQKGVDFAKVFSPFALYSPGEVELGIANIRLEPDSQDSSTIRCN